MITSNEDAERGNSAVPDRFVSTSETGHPNLWDGSAVFHNAVSQFVLPALLTWIGLNVDVRKMKIPAGRFHRW
jgi:hypothetical protein